MASINGLLQALRAYLSQPGLIVGLELKQALADFALRLRKPIAKRPKNAAARCVASVAWGRETRWCRRSGCTMMHGGRDGGKCVHATLPCTRERRVDGRRHATRGAFGRAAAGRRLLKRSVNYRVNPAPVLRPT
jgi:hypothetical protein